VIKYIFNNLKRDEINQRIICKNKQLQQLSKKIFKEQILSKYEKTDNFWNYRADVYNKCILHMSYKTEYR